MAGNFLENCLRSLFSTSVFIGGCSFLLIIALPATQIALGAVNIYECPAAPLIPVYVMVCGILALLLMGLFALPRLLCPAAQANITWTLFILGLVLFVFIWFLFGSYQIYSIYPPSYTKITIDPSSFNNSIYTPTPTAPDNKTSYTKITIDPNSFNNSIYTPTPTAPDNKTSYTKITIDPNSFNNSIYTPTAPDNKTGLTSENQNQSLPNLNHTWVINNNRNHTLKTLIETLATGNISSETHREHLKAPQTRQATAAVPHCNRTVYLFAFWTTTLVYVFAGHALVIVICIYCFIKMTDIIKTHI